MEDDVVAFKKTVSLVPRKEKGETQHKELDSVSVRKTPEYCGPHTD